MSVLDNQKVVRKWNKKVKRFTVGIASLLVMASVAYAAGGFDRLKDNVKLGQGTATNKNLIFDIGSGSANPVIRSTSGGTLQFSNNGVDYSTFGSGGGGLGINHAVNPDFELNANGYNAYQDAAGVAPVDATGGTPTVAITRTTVTGEIIRGTGTGKIVKDAVNRQGEGVSTPFTIDNADKNSQQTIQFDFVASSGYANCDVKVYVVETTGPAIINPSQQCLPNGSGHFQATFQTTGSTTYRLALHVSTVSTVAYNIFIDNVQEGPGSVVIGPTVEDWQTYTPTVVGTGCSNYLGGLYKRVGDTVFFQIDCYDGFTARSSTVTIKSSLPFPVDPTWNATSPSLGTYTISNSAGTTVNGSVIQGVYDGVNSIYGVTPATGNNLRDVDLGTINAQWQVKGSYKVQGWDSSVFLSNTSVEYAWNSDISDANDLVSFGYGSQGVFIGNYTASHTKLVRFKTPIQPTDKITLEIRDPSWDNWHDVANISAENGLVPFTYQSTTSYGIGISTNDTSANTDIAISFGTYGAPTGGTYASAGTAWSTFNNYRWRVVKSSNPLTLGHNVVTQTSSGLVKQAGQLQGTNTNDSADAGMVGEEITGYTGLGHISANVTQLGYATITASPGDWLCYGGVEVQINSGTDLFGSGDFFEAGINDVTPVLGGNDLRDQSIYSLTIANGVSMLGTSTSKLMTQSVPTRRVHVPAGANVPVYLVIYFSTGAAVGNYSVAARVTCDRFR